MQSYHVYDQNAKADAGKLRLTLVPRQIIKDIAETREYGLKKYTDPENWRKVELERYRDALFRHLIAYLDDPDGVDEESGIKHYKHIATNVAFICELEKEKDETSVHDKQVENGRNDWDFTDLQNGR